MTTYNFYTNSSLQFNGGKPATATPGDTSTIKVRRGICDTTKQQLNNADVAQVVPVFAGEVVLDMYARVITADTTTNLDLEVGFGGGTELGQNVATTPANLLHTNGNFVPLYFAANNYATIMPNNAVACDAGVFEVVLVVTKSFDKM